MAREIERLTSAKVKNAKPGTYPDGGGLYLQVTRGREPGQVNKSWFFRFKFGGREPEMGLGSLKTVGLAEAREKARTARLMVADGVNPIEARKAKKAATKVTTAKSATFEWCATQYMAAHEAGWRNAIHRQQWRNTLTTYAYPVIAKLPVGAVDTGMVMRILSPIWTTKNETASRLRGRLEKILDWAKVNGYREPGENPARWQGHLEHLLAARAKVGGRGNHPALPWDQIPAFMAELRRQPGIAARALEFVILTAARSGEVRGMLWEGELGTDKVWTVPAERMKLKREHRVPLTAAAVAVIDYMAAARENELVFPGERDGRPLSDMTLIMVIRRMNEARRKAGLPLWVDPKQGNRDVVPHGFRSSFRDWVNEAEDNFFPEWLAEAALAHASGDKVEKAYKRGDALAKRRKLMEAWAVFCGDFALRERKVPDSAAVAAE